MIVSTSEAVKIVMDMVERRCPKGYPSLCFSFGLKSISVQVDPSVI